MDWKSIITKSHSQEGIVRESVPTEEQAANLTAYVVPAEFEPEGDPVSCPFWFTTCWAVEMYRQQCTRDNTCSVYKFLLRNKGGE